jgi:hypothetical protein
MSPIAASTACRRAQRRLVDRLGIQPEGRAHPGASSPRLRCAEREQRFQRRWAIEWRHPRVKEAVEIDPEGGQGVPVGGCPRTGRRCTAHRFPHRHSRRAASGQNSGDAAARRDQREQQVLAPDAGMPEVSGQRHGSAQHAAQFAVVASKPQSSWLRQSTCADAGCSNIGSCR